MDFQSRIPFFEVNENIFNNFFSRHINLVKRKGIFLIRFKKFAAFVSRLFIESTSRKGFFFCDDMKNKGAFRHTTHKY